MNELFNSIKTSILGTKTAEIDKEIDGSFRSIEKFSLTSDRNKYLETIRNLISKVGDGGPDNVLKNLQSGTAQIQSFDQSGRISRYGEYDAIVKKISYCQRALECLVDHIISPDDINKSSLQYVSEIDDENTTLKTTVARCKKIEKKINLEKKIKNIIKTTLKKGDNFIEIVASPKGENALTILHEGKEIELDENQSFNIGPVIEYTHNTTLISEGKETKITTNNKLQLETSYFSGVLSGISPDFSGTNISGNRAVTYRDYNNPNFSKDEHVPGGNKPKFDSEFSDPEKINTNIEDADKTQLRDLFIAVHDPRYVIRLETQRFKTCLGYLIFPKIDPRLMASTSAMMNSASNSVDGLCVNIIDQIHKQLKNPNDHILISDDMKESILNYINSLKNNSDLRIRYVAPELMVHFRINYESYDPYGESIFDCVNFDCRLLIALKTATTIKRLTYATDKRVISVETGLPRDAKNVIESIKEGLNKKKISVDNMGSINTIPSQIPTFETIYVPMRDGKKFVEFDKMEWGQNPQDDVEPLKFMRDNIVANLGVPAPYLGLEENTSNRSLLTAENINFTRTIISFQKELSIPLKELFEKIYKLVYNDYENLDRVQITFQEPRISPYEHQMEYVEQMQRLIEALKTLGVPVEYMKKKYLPHLDWDEIEKFAAMEKLKKETNELPADTPGGIGGVLGGMGGGF
jgi:hypothetical protein